MKTRRDELAAGKSYQRAARESIISGGQHRYEAVKTHILQGIVSGRWKVGERLPPEPQLVELLAVSRMTVHRALRELTSDGVLIRRQGSGTFVAPPKPQGELLRVNDIAADIRARGFAHSARVLKLAAGPADRLVADALGLKSGARVFHSEIVHFADGLAVLYEERNVNPRLAPDYLKQDFNRVTPNEYLMRATPVTEIEHVIHAIRPDRKLCRLLEIEADEPCLMLLRRTWSGEAIATSSRFVYPGHRFSLASRYRAEQLREP